MMRELGLVFVVVAAVSEAGAQPSEYIDDRSSAEALVRSLYNAANRKEYARAWDYFGEQKPAKDFRAFVQGYEKTERVAVETGPVSEEGAAGSIYYQVPVAIRATATDGSESTFAGCFTVRLLQPANQEPPFRPLQLEKGSLRPAEGELSDIVPASCGDGQAPTARDRVREKIEAAFEAAYGDICHTLAADADAEPEITDLSYRATSQTADEAAREARLFGFPCIEAAYNTAEVYYFADDLGGFRQLQFAEPELDIHYQNGDFEGRVEAVNVIGYRVTDMLVNSFYDAASRTLQSFNKWRGIGDASSSATYLFRDGAFTLVKYEVDASYDGEINPEPVLDHETAP